MMKGRDWLMTQDWSDAEIELALETAATLKKEFKSGVHVPASSTQDDFPDLFRQIHPHPQLV